MVRRRGCRARTGSNGGWYGAVAEPGFAEASTAGVSAASTSFGGGGEAEVIALDCTSEQREIIRDTPPRNELFAIHCQARGSPKTVGKEEARSTVINKKK